MYNHECKQNLLSVNSIYFITLAEKPVETITHFFLFFNTGFLNTHNFFKYLFSSVHHT